MTETSKYEFLKELLRIAEKSADDAQFCQEIFNFGQFQSGGLRGQITKHIGGALEKIDRSELTRKMIKRLLD